MNASETRANAAAASASYIRTTVTTQPTRNARCHDDVFAAADFYSVQVRAHAITIFQVQRTWTDACTMPPARSPCNSEHPGEADATAAAVTAAAAAAGCHDVDDV